MALCLLGAQAAVTGLLGGGAALEEVLGGTVAAGVIVVGLSAHGVDGRWTRRRVDWRVGRDCRFDRWR